MPGPHSPTGLPTALLAVLVIAVVAGIAWLHRHRLGELIAPSIGDPDIEAEKVPTQQGAVPFPGFDPDQIYGRPPDTPT